MCLSSPTGQLSKWRFCISFFPQAAVPLTGTAPEQAKQIVSEHHKAAKQYKKAFDFVLTGKLRWNRKHFHQPFSFQKYYISLLSISTFKWFIGCWVCRGIASPDRPPCLPRPEYTASPEGVQWLPGIGRIKKYWRKCSCRPQIAQYEIIHALEEFHPWYKTAFLFLNTLIYKASCKDNGKGTSIAI